jgi:hypothetical protein
MGIGEGFEGAEFNNAKGAAGLLGVPKFIDANFGAMRVATPIHQEIGEEHLIERMRKGFAEPNRAATGDIEFGHGIVGAFIDPGSLAAGSKELACKDVGESGMILPVPDHGGEKIGSGEERAGHGFGSAEAEMSATSGAGDFSVEPEFSGAESDFVGCAIKLLHPRIVPGPISAGGQVNLNDAGVRSESDPGETGIGGGRVTVENEAIEFEFSRGLFDVMGQETVRFEIERRQKDLNIAASNLDGHGPFEGRIGEIGQGEPEAEEAITN